MSSDSFFLLCKEYNDSESRYPNYGHLKNSSLAACTEAPPDLRQV